jgi:hypothetical protein
MKAMRALTRYAAAGIEETGLGLSDFGVLEILLQYHCKQNMAHIPKLDVAGSTPVSRSKINNLQASQNSRTLH